MSKAVAPVEDEKVDSRKVNATFASQNPNHKVYVKEITVAELEKLFIDPNIQRNIVEPEVAKIVAKYNPSAIGVLTVSRRYDGVESVLDGQQRRMALMTLAGLGRVDPDDTVTLMVHEGLAIEEEAALFLLLNDRRSVDAIRRFKTRLVAKEAQAQGIQDVLNTLDIKISAQGVQAIETLDKIYEQPEGNDRLFWSLSTIQKVYDTDRRGGCYDGRVILAFSLIHAAFIDILDEPRFIEALYNAGDRVTKLRGAGKMKAEIQRGNLSYNMAEVMIGWYNGTRRRTNKLPAKLPSLPRKTLDGLFQDAQAQKDQAEAATVAKQRTSAE